MAFVQRSADQQQRHLCFKMGCLENPNSEQRIVRIVRIVSNSANSGEQSRIVANSGKQWQIVANSGKQWQIVANSGKQCEKCEFLRLYAPEQWLQSQIVRIVASRWRDYSLFATVRYSLFGFSRHPFKMHRVLGSRKVRIVFNSANSGEQSRKMANSDEQSLTVTALDLISCVN